MGKDTFTTRDDLLRAAKEFGEVIVGDPPPPPGFGHHPNVTAEAKANRQLLEERTEQMLRDVAAGSLDAATYFEWQRRLQFGKGVSVTQFFDQRHPGVCLIPARQLQMVHDRSDDVINYALFLMRLWFSSHDFYIEEDGWLDEALNTAPFWRTGDLGQLGYLVAPLPVALNPWEEISFMDEPFRHTRWIHARLSAAMADVLLARLGFSFVERAPIVLAVAYHDVATPAGGDPIKRIDPAHLDEELNFAWVLQQHGLDKKWERQFGFDLRQAAAWVRNEGMPGFLLDFLDKLSYVTLDCHELGLQRDGQTRRFCLEHQLFADVWLDLQCSEDRQRLAFTDPRRLYDFLMARAHVSSELYYNPFARTYDYLLTDVVGELYRRGLVSWQDLVTWNKSELLRKVKEIVESKRSIIRAFRDLADLIPHILEPQQLAFQWFPTREERDAFAAVLGDRLHHLDETKPFKTGLDWPVFTSPDERQSIAPLRSFLSEQQIFELEWLARSRAGYYAYYHR